MLVLIVSIISIVSAVSIAIFASIAMFNSMVRIVICVGKANNNNNNNNNNDDDDFLKHKQVNIKVNSQCFDVIVTPYSRQSE